MRGADTFTESLFTMRRLEDFVWESHPLRPIRTMVNQALAKMDRLFASMYEADIKGGPPEHCAGEAAARDAAADSV
jgi:hypothetical protein